MTAAKNYGRIVGPAEVRFQRLLPGPIETRLGLPHRLREARRVAGLGPDGSEGRRQGAI